MANVSRRGMLGFAGGGAALGAAGFAGGWGASHAAADEKPSPGERTYDFFGEHQAGIVTPAQDRLYFATFDVTATTRDELESLLRAWSLAAARMMRGETASDEATAYDAPPADTGEAEDLPPSGLTITFGFGPTLFRDEKGKDRFGLADKQPKELRELPHFPADKLDPRRSGGDIAVQACADDPQVAVHAIRNLSRIAFGLAAIRWAQLGFGRTSSTSTSQATPRNLFGFKDGTANIKAESRDVVDDHVWVGRGDDPKADWMTGGSYLVARRITMHLETWDRSSLREQEAIIGRDRPEGAPLSGGKEFDEPKFDVKGRGGEPLIAKNSHVFLAHPKNNGGAQMLRRGYNFTDGNDALGRLDAGLFFLAYVRRPSRQYIPMQMRMSREDALMEYLKHTGSGLFAVPPGVPKGGFVGQQLFTS